MKRLNWLAALAASTMLFSAAAGADDDDGWRSHRHHSYHGDRHYDRHDRWHRGDRRWDDRRWERRRYGHSRPYGYWAPSGHRYWNDYRHGYRGGHYHGGYYDGRHYCPPRYRRSGFDGTLILSFPLW